MSLNKNLFNNAFSSTLQKLIRFADQLLLVPFFISSWGVAYYGEWLTLTVIPSIMSYSNLGIGAAAANSLVLQHASGKLDRAADIAKSGFYAVSSAILLGMFLFVMAVLVANYYDVFDKSLISARQAVWSVTILVFARFMGFYNQLYESYYRAVRKAALSMNLMSLKKVLDILATVVVLVCGYGIIVLALSQLVVAILFIFMYARKAKTLLRFKSTAVVRKKDMKEIFKKGFGYLLYPVWQSIFFQGSTFIVRVLLGPAAVTLFNTTRTLTRSVNQFFNLINGTVFSELQYEYGANNTYNVHRLIRISFWLTTLCAFTGVIFLLFFGKLFYGIWTDHQLEVPNTLWNVFMIAIFFNAMWWTMAMVFRAVNKPYHFSVMALVASITSLGTTYLLTQSIGINGAAYGVLTLEVILAIYVIPVACRLINMPVLDLYTKAKDDFFTVYKVVRVKLTSVTRNVFYKK